MMRRCYDHKSVRYVHYGGRGIQVCDEWHDYESFSKWAEFNGYTDTLTLERVDVEQHYSADNCVWIPLEDQALNTRRSKLLSGFGEEKSMARWVRDERCVVSYYTLRSRIRYGWRVEDALVTPASPNQTKGCHRE